MVARGSSWSGVLLPPLTGCDTFIQGCSAPFLHQCKVLLLAGAGTKSVAATTSNNGVGDLLPFDVWQLRVDDLQQKLNLVTISNDRRRIKRVGGLHQQDPTQAFGVARSWALSTFCNGPAVLTLPHQVRVCS
jgi:hypothetical protein